MYIFCKTVQVNRSDFQLNCVSKSVINLEIMNHDILAEDYRGCLHRGLNSVLSPSKLCQ